MAEKILVVEDDPSLLRGVMDNLKFAGYSVVSAETGDSAIEKALSEKPDLMLLDIMLPKVNGYEVCRYLREEGMEFPILMLTAKGEVSDKVLGLRIGADDYITKPFDIRELLARVEAFLRRRRAAQSEVRQFGEFVLDQGSHCLRRNGEEIVLTPKEYGLLDYLLRHAGRAVTREEILDAVWGREIFVSGRSVDRCINTLRTKIERDARNPRWIRTIRDLGYRFEEE